MVKQAPGVSLKSIRIAVFGTRGFPGVQGGIEAHCQSLYPRLAAMGCDVVVYTRGPYMNRKGSFRYEGVRLIPLPCLRHPALETFSHSLLAVIAVLVTRPDIVHVHAVGPSLFVPMLRLAGLRVVMTHHGPDYKREKWGWQARRVLKAGETCGARYANALIAVSPYIASYVQRSFKRPASFIPNGMCLQESPIGAEALDRLGLVKQRYILGIGRLVPEKCFHDLIDAFVLFQKTHPDCSRGWKLVIVGRADHKSEYSRQLASKASACRDVVMAGFMTGEELRQVYGNAGMFVLPSSYEGLSLALLEAMAFGLPCIASDIEANRGMGLSPDRLFRLGDTAALCDKLVMNVEEPLTAEHRGNQKEMVRQMYDWSDIARKTMELYCEVLG